MWVAGFSINILTLLALVLSTGLVVDDAIVVIENISRQRALGPRAPRPPRSTAPGRCSSRCSPPPPRSPRVFIPISFFPGITGSLFSEFGFVLAFAVTLSCFVALTLSPMLASRLISDKEMHHHHNFIGRAIMAFGEKAKDIYAVLLDAALAAPFIVILAAVIFAGIAFAGFQLLPSELTPAEDRGQIPISITVPQGSTVDYAADQIKLIQRAAMPLLKSGEATSMFTIASASGTGGFMFITLADWSQRTRSQAQITAQLNRSLRDHRRRLRFAVQGRRQAAGGDGEAAPLRHRAGSTSNTTQAQVFGGHRTASARRPPASRSATSPTPCSSCSAARTLGNFYIGDDANRDPGDRARRHDPGPNTPRQHADAHRHGAR